MHYFQMHVKHSIVFAIVNYLIILLDKKVCPRIVQLLCYMYLNQACCVKRTSKNSTDFTVSSGVKQGAVISPILFSAYMDILFKQLKHNGIGCHVGPVYAGAFGYADDVALVAHLCIA